MLSKLLKKKQEWKPMKGEISPIVSSKGAAKLLAASIKLNKHNTID